jgi:mediator of RNA polymerase II transcription subunit 13
LPRLCESFLHCKKNYEAVFTGEKQASRTAIVLKLVPIEWVASIATIPLPSPKEYNMLAKDVYERCLTHTNPYASTSSIQLAEPIPKTLDFKVTANPTYNLARSPLTIHIAYTWPYGSEWLCLSAIDNLGRLHWEASYCFGTATESDVWPTFRAMVADIWSGALDMVDEPERKRSIYIVKDEPMHPEELDAWTTQKPPSPDQPSLITLILLCAEIAPPIYYSPTPSYLTPNLPEEPTTYATPASTPLPTAQTPTSSDPLASPGLVKSAENLEADPSARIVDPFEESWGILSTRAFYTQKFNLGPNIHSLGSGYLLKRAGPVDADGWIMLGVHVVAAERWSEGMMKELLTQWRALGLLARERGVETQKSTLPWHLAVARKCWKGVSARMKYVPGVSK